MFARFSVTDEVELDNRMMVFNGNIAVTFIRIYRVYNNVKLILSSLYKCFTVTVPDRLCYIFVKINLRKYFLLNME